MLRRDPNGQLVYEQGFFFTKRMFKSRRVSIKVSWNEAKAMAEQMRKPVLVGTVPPKVWWMFRNEFYCEDEGFSETQVHALILDRLRKKTKHIERAVAAMDGNAEAQARRESIPDTVQAVVWNRDGGKCVKCGSRQRLEFDHIIPVSQGGANTARNLQILCENCNRSKGANIG
jgi:5-methylcytosine-specific restriction endonuclease McrA